MILVGRYVVLLVLLAVCCVGGGCSKERITCENVARIQMNMTVDAVRDVLGEEATRAPAAKSGAGAQIQIYSWKRKDGKYIEVGFRDGKVVMVKSAQGQSQPWC